MWMDEWYRVCKGCFLEKKRDEAFTKRGQGRRAYVCQGCPAVSKINRILASLKQQMRDEYPGTERPVVTDEFVEAQLGCSVEVHYERLVDKVGEVGLTMDNFEDLMIKKHPQDSFDDKFKSDNFYVQPIHQERSRPVKKPRHHVFLDGDQEMRKCNHCDEAFPYTSEYFYSSKDKLLAKCKTCFQAQKQANKTHESKFKECIDRTIKNKLKAANHEYPSRVNLFDAYVGLTIGEFMVRFEDERFVDGLSWDARGNHPGGWRLKYDGTLAIYDLSTHAGRCEAFGVANWGILTEKLRAEFAMKM